MMVADTRRYAIVFGPHYFVDLIQEGGSVTFVLGATHHGFKADASELGGELERFINARPFRIAWSGSTDRWRPRPTTLISTSDRGRTEGVKIEG